MRNLYLFHTLSRKICQIVKFAVLCKSLIETMHLTFQKGFTYFGEVHFSTENWESFKFTENQIQNKNQLTKMKIFERWWKSARKFQDFSSSELKTCELVVGFGPKGMPGKSEVILCQLLRSLNFRFVETEIRKKECRCRYIRSITEFLSEVDKTR